ncbi:MAG: class I SAM-dependent methyltransferase [Gammaproteobacteria bacterium]|nr:class I SAM-dependent methyltransferase [Gammaproteobacteria bacterium]MBU1647673.1 class I SAM-dependent methyltransferase [Gammaproteobacteria bacterium]MBU1971819.1 class I SAM-dependent methyltransferase [Gammaproteobacteria bacterium]
MRSRLKNLNRHLIDRAVAAYAAALPPGITMLDVGAGGGHYRHHFSGQRYLAVDRGYENGSHRGLDIVGDVRRLPVADGAVEAAMCVEVIEHVFETEAFLAELARVLASGGRLLLTSPLCYGEHMQPWDFHRFTRYALQRLLDAAGFEIESLAPRGGFFTLAAYLVARVPDELVRNGGRLARLAKPLARLACTYLAAPLLLSLDGLDRQQRFTLGFVCVARKR